MHARAGLLAHRGSRLRLDLWTAAEKDPANLPLWLLLVAVESHMVAEAPRLMVRNIILQMLLCPSLQLCNFEFQLAGLSLSQVLFPEPQPMKQSSPVKARLAVASYAPIISNTCCHCSMIWPCVSA